MHTQPDIEQAVLLVHIVFKLQKSTYIIVPGLGLSLCLFPGCMVHVHHVSKCHHDARARNECKLPCTLTGHSVCRLLAEPRPSFLTAHAGVAAAVLAHLFTPITGFLQNCAEKALGACSLLHQGILVRVRKMSFYTVLDATHTTAAVAAADGDTESLEPGLQVSRSDAGVEREGAGRKIHEDAVRERKGRGSDAEAKREVLRVLEQNTVDPQELLLPKGSTTQSDSV